MVIISSSSSSITTSAGGLLPILFYSIRLYSIILLYCFIILSTASTWDGVDDPREFKDVVFEDVVIDNNSCVTLLSTVIAL